MSASEKNPYRCLIMEDNVPAAELMKIFLKKHDISAEIAVNGKVGLDMFLEDPSGYHAVFLDIQMPEMDGYEVAQRIRQSGTENASTIPLIAMSGSNTGDTAAESRFNLFLRKPFEFRSLYDALFKLLQNSRCD